MGTRGAGRATAGIALAALMVGMLSPAALGRSDATAVGVAPERAPKVRLIGARGVPMPRALRHAGRTEATPSRPYADTAKLSRGAQQRLNVAQRGVLQRARPAAVQPRASATTTITGMNQISSASSTFGWGYPPDTILSRGPTRELEMVNRRARLFGSTGTVYGTADLNTFFGAVNASGSPTGPLLFDPKVYYDRNATYPRFIAVALQASVANTPRLSRMYIAISRSSAPSSLSTGWCRYWFNARLALGAPADSWADFPSLGVGADAIAVTTNQFNWTGDAAVARAAIWAWAKNAFTNNAAGCPAAPATRLWTTRSGQALPTTLQPAQEYTSPSSVAGVINPVYFVNTYTNTANYGIWRIANVASGTPLLWGPLVLAGNWTNTAPPKAPNGGGGFIATGGDSRTLQVAGRGNSLTSVNTSACQFGPSPGLEACFRTVRFTVGFGASGALAGSIAQQLITGGGNGWFYFYPSVSVNASGAVVVAADAVAPGGYFSSIWGYKTSLATTFGLVWLAQGTCALTATYDNRPNWLINRAGDYTGNEADPDGVRFWVAAERAVNIGGVGCGWQTIIRGITP